jgi:hypothetical protein
MVRSLLVVSAISFAAQTSACSSASDAGRSTNARATSLAAALIEHPGAKHLPIGASIRIERHDGGFDYVTPVPRRTRVTLPDAAAGPTSLVRDAGSLRIRALGARAEAVGVAVRGMVVYPDALGTGTHIFHRPLAAAGDEEVVFFERQPTRSQLEYRIDAPDGVVRLAKRRGGLDAIDTRGRTIFRMNEPFVIGADARRSSVRVSTRDCDTMTLGARCTIALNWPDDVKYPAVLDPEWWPAGAMGIARLGHTATMLPSGRVLVTGGQVYDPSVLGGMNVTSSAEIYDPLTKSWMPTSSMSEPRALHMALLLPTGKVLVAGGRSLTSALASAELFDPESETWAPTTSLSEARSGANVIEAWDWSPLVVGGSGFAGELASSEVFDVLTSTWRTVGALNFARAEHALAELPGKQIVAIGGRNAGGWTSSVEMYDPATESWSSFANLTTPRSAHTATSLRNGRILVTGGYDAVGTTLASAELIDASGVVTAAPAMAASRWGHTATLLGNGNVLVVGGNCEVPTCLEYSEEYDSKLNAWETPVPMDPRSPMRFHTSTPLDNGHVLIAGGFNFGADPDTDPTYADASVYDSAKCKPPGVGGTLAGGIAGAPNAVDLTTEGTTDWVYSIDWTDLRKVGGNLIASPSALNGASLTYDGYAATTHSWSDGTPYASGAQTVRSLYSGGVGAGYQLAFPAAPITRIARIRLGATAGAGLLHAELSDNSCAVYETVVTDADREVSLVYLSPNPGATLNVRFTLLQSGTLVAGGITLASAPSYNASFETDLDPNKSDYTVTLDNPLTLTNVALDFVNAQWNGGGPVPEEVMASGAGFTSYNVDYTFQTWGGDGPPAGNYTAAIGSVEDEYYSWPNAVGSWTAGTASSTFAGHGRGIRVGYTPLNVAFQALHPDYSSSVPGNPVTVKLDPNVDLVPFQVVVMRSGTFPASTTLNRQLAFFDQIHLSGTTRFTNGATGELEYTQRSFIAPPGTPLWDQPTPWMSRGADGYYVGSDLTPDSAWASCGIQFRLVNYFEMDRPNKYVLPQIRKLATQPEDDDYFAKGTLDDAPCYGNHAAAVADPRYMDDVPLLIFMQRSGFPESLEEGRALSGLATACVKPGAGPTVIAHEIGHIMDMPDCSGDCSDPACNMMCSLGGGAMPPTASECSRAKSWATGRSAYFR